MFLYRQGDGEIERHRHPNKEIEKALVYAEEHAWRVKDAKGHPHSIMYCPHNDKDCRCGEFCITSVWSTPRSPEAHARQLRRVIDNCTGGAASEDEKTEDNNE